MTRMSGFIGFLLFLLSFQASARLVTGECKIPAGVYRSTNTLAGHEIEFITDGRHGVFQLQHSGTEKTVFFVMSRPKPPHLRPHQTEGEAPAPAVDTPAGDIQAQRRGRGKHGPHRPGHRPPPPPGHPPHHRPHPPGGPGHHMPPPPVACKGTHLSIEWNAQQSVPAGISGGFAGIYDPVDKTIQGAGELKIEGASGKGPTVLEVVR